MLLLMLSNALIFIVEYLPSLRAGWHGMASIREVLSDDRPPQEAEDSKTLPPLEHEIVLDNIVFTCDEVAAPALDGVSLRIAKGSYTAIVGRSGSGKSTVLSLLMRFYDPDSGRVTIDGHDLKAVDPASLRTQVGVVLQDNYIFDASLRDNVRLGRPEATDEALREAIIAAGLGDYIMSLPEKEHTLLGEYGVFAKTIPAIRFTSLPVAKSKYGASKNSPEIQPGWMSCRMAISSVRLLY
jgi:ATP-binding cassette subfamily B protein